MKAEIHPTYASLTVTCNCGNTFVTASTLGRPELKIEVCAECHPFYTGKQKIVDSGGRVERFNKKFKKPTTDKSTTGTGTSRNAS